MTLFGLVLVLLAYCGFRVAAMHARGLHGPRLTAYTTHDTANQAFVDAYMASHVTATTQ